jgi:hypothetical protein
MKTFEELVNDFVLYVKKSHETEDYSNMKLVKEHNKFIDEYRKIAREINKNYNKKIGLFAELLNEENVKTACAVCIIELFENNEKYIESAKNAIKEYVNTTDNIMDKIGFELYLKKLEK